MQPVRRERSGGYPDKGSSNRSPTKDPASSAAVALRRPSLEQGLLPSVQQEEIHTTTSDKEDDEAPTSWSFAARQRFECARIARLSRFTHHRIRHELRGLALDHAELLLGTVARRVVEDTKRDPEGPRRQEQSRVDNRDCDLRGGDRYSGREGQAAPPRDRRHLGVGDEEQGDERDEEEGKCQVVRRRSNLRHEARPCEAWSSCWALAIDEEEMGELSTLALETSLLEDATGGGLEPIESAGLVVEWRKAFRQTLISAGGHRPLLASKSFRSRISLPDKCLSVSRAITLACELIPHATETLAAANQLGAKPVLVEIFEAEITPNLRGEEFFPITHRFHGEQQGITEDVFLAAALKLSSMCLGGIDTQLSEVSSDQCWGEDGERAGGVSSGEGVDKGQPLEAVRTIIANKDYRYPSVLDASAWDENYSVDSPVNETPCGGGVLQEGREKSFMGVEQTSEVCGISSGPCGGIKFQVDVRGKFEDWDLQVLPPLQDFVGRATQAQLHVLTVLAQAPSILEHPEVKPYEEMVEGYGLGFDLPQGGGEGTDAYMASERRGEDNSETTGKPEHSQGSLDECDWLRDLSEDPYYRGLQDKVVLSLASSHNAVYRMANGFRHLLEEFQSLETFAEERDARYSTLQKASDPDVIAEKLIASASGTRGKTDSLDLSPVLVARSTAAWLKDWYSRFENYRQNVRANNTDSAQTLLLVNTTSLIDYLVAPTKTCLEDIRLIGPRMMLNATATLGAVFRRCIAVLTGGLAGVDAMGEKANFLCQIEQWIWRLRNEVKRLQELGILLKNIGCFDPRPPIPSVARTGCRVVPANDDGSTVPPLSSTLATASTPTMKTMQKVAEGEVNGRKFLTKDFSNAKQYVCSPSSGIEKADCRAPAGNDCNGRSVYDFRVVENQTRVAVESLGYHLAVLQRSIDQAHINMRITSREFYSFLKKAMESLGREIDGLEVDVLDPALSRATTNPKKACSRLEGYRLRLSDLQEKESRYRHYNQLLDQDVVKRVASGGAKNQFAEGDMRLDLERVDTTRRELVLKWEAQLIVSDIRQEWENSTLISLDAKDMADTLARAARAHALAVKTAGGADELTASCEATLAYLGRVVEAVRFLHNRNLTPAFWGRVEQTLPLGEDIKRATHEGFISTLGCTAGLGSVPHADIYDKNGASFAPPSHQTAADGSHTNEMTRRTDCADPAATDEHSICSVSSKNRVRRPSDTNSEDHVAIQGEDQPPDQENATVDKDSADPAASMPTAFVKKQPFSGAVKVFPSKATGILAPRIGGTTIVSTPAGRERREQARRRAELYEKTKAGVRTDRRILFGSFRKSPLRSGLLPQRCSRWQRSGEGCH